MTNQELIKRLLAVGGLQRTAEFVRNSIDLEARTVELSFSSESEQVERWFGIEVLGHEPGEVDLSRLNSGAPVLWNHDWNDQRGVVLSARVDSDRIGRAVVRFSKSEAGETLLQDIADGIVTKVSVGYGTAALQRVGERDGVDVYRATSWRPFEISMVSVPADDDVGVGRSAEIPQGETLSRSAHVGGSLNNSERGSPAPMNELQTLFDAARQARGDMPIFDGQGNVRAVHKQTPAAVAHHSLRNLEVPIIAPDADRAMHIPTGNAAGKRTRLSDAILSGSRCAAAGAKLIIIPQATEAIPNTAGVLAFKRQETTFDVIEPAVFSRVFDGDELDESALTIYSAYVEDDIPTYGFRVSLSRAEQKSYAAGQLADITLVSIAAGIARTADAVLLSAILAQTPAPISFGAAAALGLEWRELRALVGTAGVGGTVAPDGTFRAAWDAGTSGVLAEMTPDTNATIIGAFNRSAIAVSDDIALIAERTNINGSLILTCFVNMQALLPVPGAFWTVGA